MSMPAPPGVSRRWSTLGCTSGQEFRVVFDLPADRPGRVLVSPVAMPVYSVLLDFAGIRTWSRTITTGDTCILPAQHAVHGAQTLRFGPATLPGHTAEIVPGPSPMELSLTLPDAQIALRFAGNRLQQLATVLTLILDHTHTTS